MHLFVITPTVVECRVCCFCFSSILGCTKLIISKNCCVVLLLGCSSVARTAMDSMDPSRHRRSDAAERSHQADWFDPTYCRLQTPYSIAERAPS
jgi:hypothetical protein